MLRTVCSGSAPGPWHVPETEIHTRLAYHFSRPHWPQVFQWPLLFAPRLNKKEFSLEEIYTNKNYQSPTTRR